jgi:hypothetical protein
MDRTTAITYEGRHRATLSKDGVLALAEHLHRGQRRDRRAALFGYRYTPRHSAAHREQVSE